MPDPGRIERNEQFGLLDRPTGACHDVVVNRELQILALLAIDRPSLYRFVSDALGWESSESAYPILCAKLDDGTITKADIVKRIRRINRYV